MKYLKFDSAKPNEYIRLQKIIQNRGKGSTRDYPTGPNSKIDLNANAINQFQLKSGGKPPTQLTPKKKLRQLDSFVKLDLSAEPVIEDRGLPRQSVMPQEPQVPISYAEKLESRSSKLQQSINPKPKEPPMVPAISRLTSQQAMPAPPAAPSPASMRKVAKNPTELSIEALADTNPRVNPNALPQSQVGPVSVPPPPPAPAMVHTSLLPVGAGVPPPPPPPGT